MPRMRTPNRPRESLPPLRPVRDQRRAGGVMRRRNASFGPDYTGELRLSALVRATDKLNTPAPTPSGQGAATCRTPGFGPTIPCAPSADNTIGSTCSIATTVNTLIPGLVVGGARSVWQLGQVSVDDGGPDGDGDTAG